MRKWMALVLVVSVVLVLAGCGPKGEWVLQAEGRVTSVTMGDVPSVCFDGKYHYDCLNGGMSGHVELGKQYRLWDRQYNSWVSGRVHQYVIMPAEGSE